MADILRALQIDLACSESGQLRFVDSLASFGYGPFRRLGRISSRHEIIGRSLSGTVEIDRGNLRF